MSWARMKGMVEGLTVIWHRIDKVVQCGVELRDDVLFPLVTHETEENLRLVYRVL